MEGALFAHEFAVDNHGEVDVEDHVVVDGQPQYDADQHELTVILERRWVEPEVTGLFLMHKHAWKKGNNFILFK